MDTWVMFYLGGYGVVTSSAITGVSADLFNVIRLIRASYVFDSIKTSLVIFT